MVSAREESFCSESGRDDVLSPLTQMCTLITEINGRHRPRLMKLMARRARVSLRTD